MAFPTIYVDTGGAATNSGCSDNNSADFSGSAATVSGTTITLDGTPDISGLATDGSRAIYLNDATNSNQKIFRIVGSNPGAYTIEVDVAPTGITSTSWAIGGRFVWTQASVEGALAAGWTVQFNNSPASHSGSALITARAAGDSTNGYITLQAAGGVRPVLTVSDTNNVIDRNSARLWKVQGLELGQQGASGNIFGNPDGGWIFDDLKISDAGGLGFHVTNSGDAHIGCEVSGTGSRAFNIAAGASPFYIMGCYIHDHTSDGIIVGGGNCFGFVQHTIIDSSSGRGIYYPGASNNSLNMLVLANLTIYGCGNGGIEVSDADSRIMLINSLLQDNGDTAGEYNVEFTAGSAEVSGYHDYNLFYHQGGGGGNLSGLTANDNEITDDPLFVDAANGDFRLKAGSPARGAGFPGQFLGGPLGHLDIGAVQMRTLPFENLHAIEAGI